MKVKKVFIVFFFENTSFAFYRLKVKHKKNTLFYVHSKTGVKTMCLFTDLFWLMIKTIIARH